MARRKEAQNDFDLFATNAPSKHRKHIPAPAVANAVGPSGPAMMGGPSGPAMMGGPSGPAMMGSKKDETQKCRKTEPQKCKKNTPAKPAYRYMDDETYKSLF